MNRTQTLPISEPYYTTKNADVVEFDRNDVPI